MNIKILTTYNPHGFDRDGIHQYTNDKYDSKGFNIKGEHKDTKTTYDPNGFDRDGIHQYTHDKYDDMVLIDMVKIKILKLYMILMVLIYMVNIKILKLCMIIMVLINMA